MPTNLDHVMVAAQLPSSRVFGDQVVAAAMIDRSVHHADVLALKSASYRLRDRSVETLPSITAEQERLDQDCSLFDRRNCSAFERRRRSSS